MQHSSFFSRSGRVALAVALVAGLPGCGSPSDNGKYVGDTAICTDFEDLAGWVADPSGLTDVHAHSGKQALFVSADREFSLTYQLPLGFVSRHHLKALDVSAWVYVPSAQASSALTVQVFAPTGRPANGPLYSAALPLLDQVHKYGKWQQVQKVFVLPNGLPEDAVLRLYLWRGGSPEPVYLDDLLVKAHE